MCFHDKFITILNEWFEKVHVLYWHCCHVTKLHILDEVIKVPFSLFLIFIDFFRLFPFLTGLSVSGSVSTQPVLTSSELPIASEWASNAWLDMVNWFAVVMMLTVVNILSINNWMPPHRRFAYSLQLFQSSNRRHKAPFILLRIKFEVDHTLLMITYNNETTYLLFHLVGIHWLYIIMAIDKWI